MSANRQKQTSRRAPSTAWKKGQSGNPSGRPRVAGHVSALARQHTEAAIETLVQIMNDGTSDAARARAAEAILDRGYGRPATPLELDPEAGGEEDAREARRIAMAALSSDELRQLRNIQMKLNAAVHAAQTERCLDDE